MNEFDDDMAPISEIDAVPQILDIVCRTTGMGFAAVARVTDDRWIACQVRDQIAFGLKAGGELKVATTICNDIRQERAAVAIDAVSTHPFYRTHPTPATYGFESYIPVEVDQNQLENACSTSASTHTTRCPFRGTLTVRIANRTVVGDVPAAHDVEAGDHVVLAVRDSGAGMPPDAIARAFEPSSRPRRSESGPARPVDGLRFRAAVGWASPDRIGGRMRHDRVDRPSALYRHRRFDRCTFRGPCGDDRTPQGGARRRRRTFGAHGEVLQDLGYAVLEASDGAEALQRLATDPSVCLLITELDLPGDLDGRALVGAARADRPALKAMFIAGYADTGRSTPVPDPCTQTVAKPFVVETLGNQVRDFIERQGGGATI